MIETVEREAATALATPELTEPVKLVMVPGARALALLEYGRLAEAADAAFLMIFVNGNDAHSAGDQHVTASTAVTISAS